MVDAIEATIDPADRPFAVERLYAGEAGGIAGRHRRAAHAFPDARRPAHRHRAARRAAAEAEARSRRPADDDDDGEAADERASRSTRCRSRTTSTRRRRRPRWCSWRPRSTARAALTKRLLEKAHVRRVRRASTATTPRAPRCAPGRPARSPQDELRGRRHGRSIRRRVQLLVDRAGGDISKLRGDVERLLLFTEGRNEDHRRRRDEVVVTDETDE